MRDNISAMTVLTLSGLSGIEKYRIPLFIATLLCYCLIWVANVTIIATIVMDKTLHEPMYIFLCNLCINALFATAGFYPKFLSDLVSSARVISFAGCLLQGYVIHAFTFADFFILLLMAFDRYVAICRPLVYHSVMTRQNMSILISIAWLVPLSAVSIGTIITSTVRLCGSNVHKIYCINVELNRMACTPSLAALAVPFFNFTIFVLNLLAIFWTYIHIVYTCIHSAENRVTFMKTCLPHIISIVVISVSMSFDLIYVRFGPVSLSDSVKNFMAIEFLIVPPLSNPVIYGLKLKKIRNRLLRNMQSFQLKLK